MVSQRLFQDAWEAVFVGKDCIFSFGVFLIETLASTSQYLQEEGLLTVLPAHITSVLCSTLNVPGIREMSRNLEDKP